MNTVSKRRKSKSFDHFTAYKYELNKMFKEAQIYARVTGQEEICEKRICLKKVNKKLNTVFRNKFNSLSNEIKEDEDGFRYKAKSEDINTEGFEDFF